MLRISKWGGLVTAASPYIIPPGGATEQINAQSLYPGQLTVRGGMAPVSEGAGDPRSSQQGAFLELWGYSRGSGDTEIVFAFTDQGEIVEIENPRIEQ
jgi:hypothetical protein